MGKQAMLATSSRHSLGNHMHLNIKKRRFYVAVLFDVSGQSCLRSTRFLSDRGRWFPGCGLFQNGLDGVRKLLRLKSYRSEVNKKDFPNSRQPGQDGNCCRHVGFSRNNASLRSGYSLRIVGFLKMPGGDWRYTLSGVILTNYAGQQRTTLDKPTQRGVSFPSEAIMTIEKQVLTIPDVARILKVSEKTITRMLQDGSIPGFKIANQWRFHPEDFENWLKMKRTERDGSARSGITDMLSQELEFLPISRLTDESLVVTNLPRGTKEEVLTALSQPLIDRGVVTNPAEFLSGLITREGMMSTGVGGGVALPHLRNPQNFPVERPLIVFGTSPEGIEWDSLDGNPVNLFLLPVTGHEVVHIRTLAAIRQALVIDGIIDLLAEAGSGKELMSILLKIETIQRDNKWN